MKVGIIGSGAIGLALANTYASVSENRVYLFSRNKPRLELSNIHWHKINIVDEISISEAVSEADVSSFDRVLCCTGLLHNDDVQPEKALKEVSLTNLITLFELNTFAPILLAKYFVPKLNKRHKSVFAALSARVGSMEDNRLGGWYSYRASKSALNMLLKNLSIEVARSQPKAIILGLHPGTVDSDLSKPFSKNVKPEKLFSPGFSAEKLFQVIENSHADDTGSILAWDGQVIPY